MKERPILFNSEMVKAILDGRKTQTRRIVSCKKAHIHSKCSVHWCKDGVALFDNPGWEHTEKVICPFGKVGDKLWVREKFAVEHKFLTDCGYEYDLVSGPLPPNKIDGYKVFYSAENDSYDIWRPSIHMPKWASRITLEITGIRVKRLQDISEEDARAEGVTSKQSFKSLWESISGEESWNKNPWVWVISFRRIK